MADYRILVMHLLDQFFWEGRDEEYRDIAYFCWCWGQEKDPYARREQNEIMESMSGYHWIHYGNRQIQILVLEAEGVKRLDRNSEEAEHAYRTGIDLLESCQDLQ